MKFLHSDLHTVTEQTLYAQAFGVHWLDQGMILHQIISECKELRQEIEGGCNEKMQEEIGDFLHAAIYVYFLVLMFLKRLVKQRLNFLNEWHC